MTRKKKNNSQTDLGISGETTPHSSPAVKYLSEIVLCDLQ